MKKAMILMGIYAICVIIFCATCIASIANLDPQGLVQTIVCYIAQIAGLFSIIGIVGVIAYLLPKAIRCEIVAEDEEVSRDSNKN